MNSIGVARCEENEFSLNESLYNEVWLESCY